METPREKDPNHITSESTEKTSPVNCTAPAAAQTGYRHPDSLLCLTAA